MPTAPVTRIKFAARRHLTSFSLMIGTLFIVLIVLEVGIRIFSPQDLGYFDSRPFRRVDSSPPHFVENIPGGKTTFIGVPVSINSRGLRGEEITSPKPPGLIRILAVGDSITFGYGVRIEDTYEKVLEKLLNGDKDGPRHEVLNGGTLGGSFADYLHFLDQKADLIQPDIVIVGVCLNDILVYPDVDRDLPLASVAVKKAPEKKRLSVRQLNNFLLRHSQLYMRLYAGVKAFSYRSGILAGHENQSLIALAPWSIHQERAWASSLSILSRLSVFCKQRGYRLILVAFPMQMQMSPGQLQFYRDNYRMTLGDTVLSGDPQRRLHDFSAANGISFIDLLPTYRAANSKDLYIKNIMIRSDPVHPSVEGYKIAAEEIFHAMKSAQSNPQTTARHDLDR